MVEERSSMKTVYSFLEITSNPASPHQPQSIDMPIYAVRTVNFKTKVDSFARRGLDNHASSKVSELAITSVSPKPIQNVIRFSHMSSELHGRKEGHYQVYEEKPRAVLRRYSGESPFEGPQLIVEMKSGGDVLNG
jgi:hypothetical protein